MYTDGRPKSTTNIEGFISISQLVSANKLVNCIFKVDEGNHIFVCVIKSISLGEELLIDYNLDCIDTKNVMTMGLVITIYVKFKLITSN